MKDGEKRILSILWHYSNGLGVNELKRKTSEKVVRWNLVSLYEKGYVDYNPNLKRGKKRIVKIKNEARPDLKLLMDFTALEKEFAELYYKDVDNITVFEQKLDLFHRVLLNLIETCLDVDPKYALRLVDTTKKVETMLLEEKIRPFNKQKAFYEKLEKIKTSG